AHNLHPHSFPTRRSSDLGHGSPWKDPGRSGTWADWITGREGRERVWNESDYLEPEHDARGRQSRGRNPGFQGPTVRPGRHPDDRSEEHTSELQSRSDIVC